MIANKQFFYSRTDEQNGGKENHQEKASSMEITIHQLQSQDLKLFMRLKHFQLISNNQQQLHRLVLLIVGTVINLTIHIMELFYHQHHRLMEPLHINIPRTIIKCLQQYDLTIMVRRHEQMVF